MTLRGVVAFTCFGLLGAGCLFGDDDDERPPPYQECVANEDCAYLDDGDACFGPAHCEYNRCERDFRQNATDCQCEYPGHCEALGMQERGCNIITCVAHQCGEQIMPAGPSADQPEGDCENVMCDGMSPVGMPESDLSDIDDDNNECTIDSCTADGPLNEPLAEGELCLDNSGICYAAQCYAGCVPLNPEMCGSEGPSEPTNNLGGSASEYGESSEVCGMLDADDIDWYQMYVEDEEFTEDILGFSAHGSAPTIEICAYMLCHNYAEGGYPEGGCANKQTGPEGSAGCCWQGAPSSLAPTWDIDCSGTIDDEGTVFFSVRALDGDTCDTYVVSGHY